MAQDESDEMPSSTTSQCIAFLFSALAEAETAEDYAQACAELVRLARHLDDEELATLATAVESGFRRRGRGRPPNLSRARQIRYMLTFGPRLGGMLGVPRAVVVRAIAARFGMTDDAAGKAFDGALKELKKCGAQRASRKEKNRDLIP